MIKRRSLLGLLAGLPFVGSALASADPKHVLPMPRVKPTLGPRPSFRTRESVENGLARPGDYYMDVPSGQVYVGVAQQSGKRGDLVWVEIGRRPS